MAILITIVFLSIIIIPLFQMFQERQETLKLSLAQAQENERQTQKQALVLAIFDELGLAPDLDDQRWRAQGPLSDAIHLELTLKDNRWMMVFYAKNLSLPTRVQLNISYVNHTDQQISLQHGSTPAIEIEFPLLERWSWFYKAKPLALNLKLDQELALSITALMLDQDRSLITFIRHIRAELEHAQAFIKRAQQGWANYTLTWPPPDEHHVTALFYLAASECSPERHPTWTTIEARDAHLWKRFEGLDHMRPDPHTDSGELIQRATLVPTAALIKAMESRGELDRMWAQGTLETSFALAWIIHSQVQTQTRRTIISTLDLPQLASYLNAMPLKDFEALIEDPDEPLIQQPERLFNALELEQKLSCIEKISMVLARLPESSNALSKVGHQEVLEHYPHIFTGELLERTLMLLHPKQQLLVLDNLMQTASPWESFGLILGRSSWLDDLRYNLSDAMRWSTLSTLLNNVSASTTSEQLLSLKILLYGSISSPPEAQVLEQFLELVEARRLQPSLWTTFDELMAHDDSLAKTIKPYYKKWRKADLSSEHVGGLSLSEGDTNAGALSVANAEQGSLTVQDHDPS